jgi:hypothetical protein
MVVTSSFSTTWKEVSKSNPCPLCQKPDWCYLAENFEAVVCGRTEAGEQPQGWRYVKDAEDDFYSQTQWVSRFEWKDPNHSKGHDKTIRQCHRKPNGKVKWSKGEQEWLPYRIEEAIAFSKSKWILGLEGETCVEAARSLGLVAITWQGSSWSTEELKAGLTKLKGAGIKGLVYLPDNDEPGRKKAELVVSAAEAIDFPVLVVDPLTLWKEMPDKGDLDDWIAWGDRNGIERKDLIQRLEQAIKKTVEAQKMKATSESKPNKSDRLKLEIQAYLQSPDIFDKVRIKGEICSSYRINTHDFNLLCQALEKQNSTPQANTFGFDDFINQGTDALEWIVPGILPKGETVLLAALAKTGKTLLATDIAYAVLT